jgi:hypothetical protein
VLLRWNDLPTHIQRELFGHALVDVEPRKLTTLKEQIARFLHTHKDDDKGQLSDYAVPPERDVKVRNHD